MEKRSRRRTRDLVTQAASQGLSQNEIGCARISMMARSTNAPCKGRIQMRKTNPLHLFKSGLQRTAGPYSWVKTGKARSEQMFSVLHPITDLGTAERIVAVRPLTAAPPRLPRSISKASSSLSSTTICGPPNLRGVSSRACVGTPMDRMKLLKIHCDRRLPRRSPMDQPMIRIPMVAESYWA